MPEISVRELKESESADALLLVWDVFMEYEAPDYSEEGNLSKLRMYGAFMENRLVGVIATRSEGAHIALFFVKGEYHGRGIGSQLFKTVLQMCPAGSMTVNSSPYAVPIYHHLGFHDMDKEQAVNGLRFTPMEWRRT